MQPRISQTRIHHDRHRKTTTAEGDRRRQTKGDQMKYLVTKTLTQATKTADEKALDLIGVYLNNLTNNLTRIAELYVARCDDSKEFHDRFRARYPRLTSSFVAGLERVGRGTMSPDLLLIGADQQRIVASLPKNMQERVIEKGIEIVTPQGTKVLPVQACPSAMLAQAIDQKSGSVRTPEEQEAWIADMSRKREQITEPRKMTTQNKTEMRFRIVGRMVEIIDPPVVLSERDLRTILAEMR
jgi:hypothetical protein